MKQHKKEKNIIEKRNIVTCKKAEQEERSFKETHTAYKQVRLLMDRNCVNEGGKSSFEIIVSLTLLKTRDFTCDLMRRQL